MSEAEVLYAGVDVGTTQIKVSIMASDGLPRDFMKNPRGITGCGFDEAAARELAAYLAEKKRVSVLGVTGSGGPLLAKVAPFYGLQVAAIEDPVQHELEVQARGIRHHLADMEGIDVQEFLLVSIGTGTSFSLVTPEGVRAFMPGLSVGGSTLVTLAGLRGISPEDIGELAAAGADSDLLMKHLYEDIGFPKGEFVLASLGRLGGDVEATDENYCYGLIKMIATLTIGHIMTIRQLPEWNWNGPVVFIGGAVQYEPLADLLKLFCGSVGLRGHVSKYLFVGATGACYHALEDDPTQKDPNRPSASRQFMSWFKHWAGVVKIALRKRT